MCEKAEEIQKLKPSGIWHTHSIPHDGGLDNKDYLYVSFFYLPKVLKERNIQLLKWDNDEGHPIIGGYGDNIEGAIWLPTQEQLQEMTEGRFHIWGNLNSLSMTASTADRASHQVCKNIDSMNELWLIYVMKEKYNKEWDGKKWVTA